MMFQGIKVSDIHVLYIGEVSTHQPSILNILARHEFYINHGPLLKDASLTKNENNTTTRIQT